MRWPWMSVARLEDAREQVQYLRGELDGALLTNAKLVDQMTRISRREAGLPEVPREPRPIEATEPMPRPLREHILRFSSQAVQRSLREQALKKHSEGLSWDDISKLVMREGDTDG